MDRKKKAKNQENSKASNIDKVKLSSANDEIDILLKMLLNRKKIRDEYMELEKYI